MPTVTSYPGVYIEEVPSGVRTITPVATSITAFIGSAPRGLSNTPVRIQSFAEYERTFGGLVADSKMSYAVSHYFQNGGSDALIVRVTGAGAVPSPIDANGLRLVAASPGEWGDKVRVRIDYRVKPLDDGSPNQELFNIFVYDKGSGATEEFRNLSVKPDDRRFVKMVLADGSALVRVADEADLSARPGAHDDFEAGNWFDDANAGIAFSQGQDGKNGAPITQDSLIGKLEDKSGVFALETAELFNLLCIPPPSDVEPEIEAEKYAVALKYCVDRRAMLIVDPPSGWKSIADADRGFNDFRSPLGSETMTRNAAMFFPRLKMGDPLKDNRTKEFVPCGAVAGVFARTDVSRGVWKSPAGIDAGLSQVREFSVPMNDPENGRINVKGLNALRNFRAYGNVIWGSRTMAGSDELGSEWKYVAIRRFALFLEESLYRGTQWVVFEPNDEPLWALIRLNIGAFMQSLFRQGAFEGRSPSEAYFVRCNKETTTAYDRNRGIVNIEVGFAPLKPAEFVIIKIQQMAGKSET